MKDEIEDQLNLQLIDTIGSSRRGFLTEAERKKYLKIWKLTYIVVPLVYFILTLIFH